MKREYEPAAPPLPGQPMAEPPISRPPGPEPSVGGQPPVAEPPVAEPRVVEPPIGKGKAPAEPPIAKPTDQGGETSAPQGRSSRELVTATICLMVGIVLGRMDWSQQGTATVDPPPTTALASNVSSSVAPANQPVDLETDPVEASPTLDGPVISEGDAPPDSAPTDFAKTDDSPTAKPLEPVATPSDFSEVGGASDSADAATPSVQDERDANAAATASVAAPTVSRTTPVGLTSLDKKRAPTKLTLTPDAVLHPQCDQPEMEMLGTMLKWADSPADASQRAAEEEKLVFLIHVSGNFEIPGYT